MAIVKAIAHNNRSLFDMLYYILDEEKLIFTYGYGLNPRYAYTEMQFVQEVWHKSNGRQYKQFIVSFSEDESNWLDLSSFCSIGQYIGEYYGRNWQTLIVGHGNTKNRHYHIIVNSVNPISGVKFTSSWSDLYWFKLYVHRIVHEYGVEMPKIDQQVYW